MQSTSPVLFALLIGCSDYTVSELSPEALEGEDTAVPQQQDDEPAAVEDDCVESSTAFDIEEVSTLQDAFGLPRVRDGLTLMLEPGTLDADETWRPVSVQVLVMYPDWFFDSYDDSSVLTVNFYPSRSPMNVQPVSKSIRIRKDDLEWSSLLLPASADWSGDDRDQVAAWLDFDLSDVVPAEGYTITDYFVSLEWDNVGFPNVGYSNFELNCAQNWTDYGNGSYVQNSGQDCSWPMFKIEIEVLNPGDCE
jgi:hypothetical protein